MLMHVTIQNWDKFNPRNDRNNHVWFRMQNNFFHDQRVFGLTDSEKILFIFLCCEASKINSDTVSLNPDYIASSIRNDSQVIQNSMITLIKTGLIAGKKPARSRQEAGKKPRNGIATGGIATDNTDNTDNTIQTANADSGESVRFNFELIYKKYPRKEGKYRGLKICQAQIKKLEDYNLLVAAVDRYVTHIANNATEARFIKHFSTFMASWRDWTDADVGSVSGRENKNEISESLQKSLDEQGRINREYAEKYGIKLNHEF